MAPRRTSCSRARRRGDRANYAVKRDGPATEIVVFGRRGEVAIPPPARSAPPAGILSRWR
jgi:hypothetical protein